MSVAHSNSDIAIGSVPAARLPQEASGDMAYVPFWGAACLLIMCVFGCDFPGKAKPTERPVLPKDVLDFSVLYQTNCAGCHGADGELGGAPPLRDSVFRTIIPFDELQHTIAEGRPGTPMPAFAIEHGGTLSQAQIQVLVFQIKGAPYKTVENVGAGETKMSVAADPAGIAPAWGPAAPTPAPANIPEYLVAKTGPRPASAELEKIRQSIFATACARCHGEHGEGAEKAGAINGPAFLNLASDQFLRRLMITGRADLKMPNFTDPAGRPANFQPLNSKNISDLVSLLRSWQQSSSGSGDLNKTRSTPTSSTRAPDRRANRDG